MKENLVWNNIERLYREYQYLRAGNATDKLHLYSIIAHATAIEGATLTEREVNNLFDTGTTSREKPLVHYLMVEDMKSTYATVINMARKKAPVTPGYLQALNTRVTRLTTRVRDIHQLSLDANRKDANARERARTNRGRVPEETIAALCQWLNERLDSINSPREAYQVSFDAHAHVATLHQWEEGNIRVACLLMHHVQCYHGLLPCKLYKGNREEYLATLSMIKKKKDTTQFRVFMARQLLKLVKERCLEENSTAATRDDSPGEE